MSGSAVVVGTVAAAVDAGTNAGLAVPSFPLVMIVCGLALAASECPPSDCGGQ